MTNLIDTFAKDLLAAQVQPEDLDDVLERIRERYVAMQQDNVRGSVQQTLAQPGHPRKSVEANEAVEEHLLEEVTRKGRLRASTSVSHQLGKARGKSSGFQSVGEPRLPCHKAFPENPSLRSIRSYETLGAIDVSTLLKYIKAQGADAAVGWGPVIKRWYEKQRNDNVAAKAGLMSWIRGAPDSKEETVLREQQVMMSEFVGNDDPSLAFEIVYCVAGKGRDESYRDPTTHRYGNYFLVSLVLPEDLALRTWDHAQKHPTFLRRVVQAIDPGLVADQEFDPQMGLPQEARTMFVHPADTPKFVPISQHRHTIVGVNW